MYDAPITKKIFDVLRFVVAQQSDLGVSTIARAVSLSKGTTFGILAGLEKEGYISKNRATRKYTVGPELFQLWKLIDRLANLAAIAKPHLDKLSKELKRSVFLGIRDGNMIRIEEVADTSGLLTISSSIGTRLPLSGGAPGKLFLSLMRDDEIEACIASQSLSAPKGYTRNQIDVWSGIQEVRRLGYAIDLTEEYRPGIWAVAMALDSEGIACPAAVWVAGFKAAITKRKVARTISCLRQTIADIEDAVQARFGNVYHGIRIRQAVGSEDRR